MTGNKDAEPESEFSVEIKFKTADEGKLSNTVYRVRTSTQVPSLGQKMQFPSLQIYNLLPKVGRRVLELYFFFFLLQTSKDMWGGILFWFYPSVSESITLRPDQEQELKSLLLACFAIHPVITLFGMCYNLRTMQRTVLNGQIRWPVFFFLLLCFSSKFILSKFNLVSKKSQKVIKFEHFCLNSGKIMTELCLFINFGIK